jgi:hypothetical protein
VLVKQYAIPLALTSEIFKKIWQSRGFSDIV